MYIKKKDKELFEEIDNNLLMPKKWNDFIKEQSKKHNLILKYKDHNHCTNCNNDFIKQCKINENIKCPKCRQKLFVKSGRIKNFEYKDTLGILDRHEDKYIIRYFELASSYINGIFKHSVCEYGRKIYDDRFNELYEIINDNLYIGLNHATICHKNYFGSNWRYFGSYWKSIGTDLIFYPYNVKSLLEGTKWQYSQLWTLTKKIQYFDLSYLMHNYTDTIELLIKLKLYNLALCPKTYSKRGNFEERFGIDKSYLSYMQKININNDELNVLSYSKIKDKRILDKFADLDLKECKKYNINLLKLNKLINFSEYEYFDYLIMAQDLKYDLKDKNVLYPKNIKESHDQLQKLIEIKQNESISKKILKRYKEISKNNYSTNKYIIFPAKTINELIDESAQQDNCVKTYAERIANRECDIYFMRYINSINKSLVTVEVRGNKVVQQRTKGNEETTKEQQKFLKEFELRLKN